MGSPRGIRSKHHSNLRLLFSFGICWIYHRLDSFCTHQSKENKTRRDSLRSWSQFFHERNLDGRTKSFCWNISWSWNSWNAAWVWTTLSLTFIHTPPPCLDRTKWSKLFQYSRMFWVVIAPKSWKLIATENKKNKCIDETSKGRDGGCGSKGQPWVFGFRRHFARHFVEAFMAELPYVLWCRYLALGAISYYLYQYFQHLRSRGFSYHVQTFARKTSCMVVLLISTFRIFDVWETFLRKSYDFPAQI